MPAKGAQSNAPEQIKTTHLKSIVPSEFESNVRKTCSANLDASPAHVRGLQWGARRFGGRDFPVWVFACVYACVREHRRARARSFVGPEGDWISVFVCASASVCRLLLASSVRVAMASECLCIWIDESGHLQSQLPLRLLGWAAASRCCCCCCVFVTIVMVQRGRPTDSKLPDAKSVRELIFGWATEE